MTRRLPILIVAVALVVGLGFLWRSLSDQPSPDPDRALAGPGLETEELTPRGAREELSQAPEVTTKATASQREVAAPEPEGVEAAFAIPDDSFWIDGRVVFPDKLPLDESFAIEARGRRFGTDRKNPREHRVQASADGRFRVAFAKKTKKGWLGIDARYMYLPSRVRVEPAKQVGPVVLEPLLGGIVKGVVAPPPGHEVSAETFEGARVGVQEWREHGMVQDTAIVGADGSYELTGLAPSSNYSLSLISPRFAGVEKSGVTVGTGVVTELDLALSLGAHLSGRVTGSDGEPLSGVAVNLLATRKSGGGTVSNSIDVQTDDEGAFEFVGIEPCTATLTVRAKDAPEIVDELGRLEEGERRDQLAYATSRGLSVSGVAQWNDGTPAADVTVEARPLEENGEVDWNSRRFQAKTDADGRFELNGLDERELVIDAKGRRILPKPEGESSRRKKRGPIQTVRLEDVRPGTRGILLVLSDGLTVGGSVLYANGQSVGTFWVKAQPDWSNRGALDWNDRVERKFDSEDGEYLLTGLKPGSWNISVRGKEFAETESRAVEVPYEGRLDFEVARAASVTGVVQSPSGDPVGGAEITKVLIEGSSQSWTNDEARTNSKGEFTLRSVRPGEYLLRASADGWATSPDVQVGLAPGEQRDGILLVLTIPCRVTGQVLPGAGEISGRSISAWGGEPWTNESAVSDADGRFEFTNLGPGNYTARVEPQPGDDVDRQVSWANAPSADFELLPGGSAHIELGAGPEQPVQVSGVVTSGGSTVADYVVHFVSVENSKQVATRTDANGAYAVTVDGPGRYSVTVRPEDKDFGVNYLVFQIEVPEGEHREDFDLPTASIAVTLLRPDGSQAGGALVGLESLDVPGLVHNVSQEQGANGEGRFDFQHLQPGSYLLRAGGSTPWNHNTGDYARQTLEVSVSAGEREAFTVQLEPGATIRGLATFADGSPAGGQSILIVDSEDRRVSAQWGNTESSGHFVVKGLPGGKLTVQIGGGDNTGETTINLSKGGEAEVSVVVPQ